MGDRYSRKMVMSVGILIWSASVLASSFAEKHVTEKRKFNIDKACNQFSFSTFGCLSSPGELWASERLHTLL